jgi:hypothetical protein
LFEAFDLPHGIVRALADADHRDDAATRHDTPSMVGADRSQSFCKLCAAAPAP